MGALCIVQVQCKRIVLERPVYILFEGIYALSRKILKALFLLTISALCAVVKVRVPTQLRTHMKYIR
jgi:hypothetical protein